MFCYHSMHAPLLWAIKLFLIPLRPREGFGQKWLSPNNNISNLWAIFTLPSFGRSHNELWSGKRRKPLGPGYFQGRIQEFLKGGAVHYCSNLQRQWSGRRVKTPCLWRELLRGSGANPPPPPPKNKIKNK